jgi:hypothetical protein
MMARRDELRLERNYRRVLRKAETVSQMIAAIPAVTDRRHIFL